MLSADIAYDELTIVFDAAQWIPALTYLRDHGFVSFIDLTAVDWPAREKRFDVVVHLLDPKANLRIRVKCHADESAAGGQRRQCLARRRLVRARGL